MSLIRRFQLRVSFEADSTLGSKFAKQEMSSFDKNKITNQIYVCCILLYKYWVAQSGMGGLLSQGKTWTVAFHEAKPSEMEQPKFYRAIIFLPFHELKPLNICFI